MQLLRCTLVLVFLTCGVGTVAGQADLLIKNGQIVDGSGNPSYMGNITIHRGRIISVGLLEPAAKQVIDARGLVVAPGFIDVHTHAENVSKMPGATNFVRMGITTLVLGNCGGSKSDLGKFFKELEDRLITPNVASLIGHNSVRSRAMGGSFMRPPTDEELDEMKSTVDQAMKDGAVGLSTGLIYLPGTFANTEELIELAKVASKHGGIYVSHMRNEGDDIGEALEELMRIAREAKLPAHVSHIKASGQRNWGRSIETLKALALGRLEGLELTQDQYLYPASSTGIQNSIPQSYREGGLSKLKERLDDPETKAKIVKRMKDRLEKRGIADYEYAAIASWRRDRRLDGLRLPAAAKIRRGSDSLDDQLELIFEIARSGGASGVFYSQSEEDIRRFQQDPHTMFASDSSIRTYRLGVPHPRGYGNSARALSEYVRTHQLLSIEEAVRRMTSLPARQFRLKDRGMIRSGAWADLVVFDPASVKDNATFEQPHQYASGMRYVLVNGGVVVENDRHTGSRPGKIVRRGK
ncbi:MAG: aminoacylase [Verrucomicrobiales bacterium]|nr:aminoacylase [Verrucomicrobiales bacterium]|tara:strand:+ start:6432 stop:8003 length:1572 start_codon:yes stop_codon:yes gene_type:complete